MEIFSSSTIFILVIAIVVGASVVVVNITVDLLSPGLKPFLVYL